MSTASALLDGGASAAMGAASATPGIVDVTATALTHRSVLIDSGWGLDAKPAGLLAPN